MKHFTAPAGWSRIADREAGVFYERKLGAFTATVIELRVCVGWRVGEPGAKAAAVGTEDDLDTAFKNATDALERIVGPRPRLPA